jgi:hypothetical protein
MAIEGTEELTHLNIFYKNIVTKLKAYSVGDTFVRGEVSELVKECYVETITAMNHADDTPTDE